MKFPNIICVILCTSFLYAFGTYENQTSLVESYNSIIDSYEKNDYELTIEKCQLLMEASEKSNNKAFWAMGKVMMALCYNRLEDQHKSLAYFNDALDVLPQIKDSKGLVILYLNIGNFYTFSDQINVKKAEEYYQKGLDLAIKSGNTQYTVYLNIQLGVLFSKCAKDAQKGYQYVKRIKPEIDKGFPLDKDRRINYLAVTAFYHFSVGEHDLAFKEFNEVIDIAISNNLDSTAAQFFLLLAELHEGVGMIEASLESYKSYVRYHNIQLKSEKEANLSLLEKSHKQKQFKKDLHKAQELNKAHDRNANQAKIILLFSAVMIVGLGYMVFILNRSSKVKSNLNHTLKTQNLELKKAKETAEQLSQMKTRFINTVSHELRTPLYAVIGVTGMLMDDNTLYKKRKEPLDALRLSSDYLLRLVNDILELGKLDGGEVKTKQVNFRIDQLLSEMCSSLKSIALDNNNKLHINYGKDTELELQGDVFRIQRILMNLVGNALKYTTSGNVFIHVQTLKNAQNDDMCLRIAIEDDGIGIPQERQNEIFNEFSQLERNTSTFEGSGLGLPIAKKLVHLLNGTISLKSEPNVGSTFTLQLPIVKAVGEAPCCEKGNPDNPHKGYKILIVDDNGINRLVTKNILEKNNFETVCAQNGEEAVDIFLKQKFDLILMDLNMPVMDGYEASKAIRSNDDEIPIIALTANDMESIVDKVMDAGLDDIITKPYDNVQFFQTILKNLDKKKSAKGIVDALTKEIETQEN